METIAVIFGSRSAEHDVSIVTALASVVKPLELTKKFRVEAIYIAKDGSWHWDDALKDITLFTSGKIDDFLKKDPAIAVRFDGGMTLLKQRAISKRNITQKIDIVFPATHGTFGEDGSLMGLLEMAGVPYVGCGLQASVLAMDKALAKIITASFGVRSPNYVLTNRSEVMNHPEVAMDKVATLTFPMFVKPTHLGSSIGISRVKNDIELRNALEVAAHYDDSIIIEEAVPNLIEVTLPVMGNDVLTPAVLERPVTQSVDFFDFETKYMKGGKKGKSQKSSQGYSELPAKLPKELYDKAVKTGMTVYYALGCTGIARVDMLIDSKSEEVFFNEVNPLPGDLYAHNWRAAGLPTVDLVTKLVDMAKERAVRRSGIETTFSTNYLKQF